MVSNGHHSHPCACGRFGVRVTGENDTVVAGLQHKRSAFGRYACEFFALLAVQDTGIHALEFEAGAAGDFHGETQLHTVNRERRVSYWRFHEGQRLYRAEGTGGGTAHSIRKMKRFIVMRQYRSIS